MMLVSAWLAPAVTITLYCKTQTPKLRPDTLGGLSPSCYLIASDVQVGPVVRCRGYYDSLWCGKLLEAMSSPQIGHCLAQFFPVEQRAALAGPHQGHSCCKRGVWHGLPRPLSPLREGPSALPLHPGMHCELC